jgi:hypothetical protein
VDLFIYLFIYGSLNDPGSSSDYKASNKMNNELERIWKEILSASVKIPWHLPGETKENHKNLS